MTTDFYITLLDSFKDTTRDTTPFVVSPPTIIFVGSKCEWQNFDEICNQICLPDRGRNRQHLLHFITTELSTTISVRGGGIAQKQVVGRRKEDVVEGSLVLGKRFKAPQIQSVLIKYINKYVMCSTCKQFDTTMEKVDRDIILITCGKCGSTRYTI